MIITQALTAGQWCEYTEAGDFFRILTDSASTSFDVKFYDRGREVVDAAAVKPGYSERFIGSKFTSLKIRASVASTVQFVVRLGNVVGYDIAPTGAVTVSGVVNARRFNHVAATVGTAANMYLGSNMSRAYLLIQNKSTTATIYVSGSPAGVNVNTGITLGPGDSWEVTTCPYDAVWAMSDTASTPVLFVEA